MVVPPGHVAEPAELERRRRRRSQLAADSTIANWTTSRPSCQRRQCVRMTARSSTTIATERHAEHGLLVREAARRRRGSAGRSTTTVTSVTVGTTPRASASDRVARHPAVRVAPGRPAGQEQADADGRHRRVRADGRPTGWAAGPSAPGVSEPVAEQQDAHRRAPDGQPHRARLLRPAARPGSPCRPRTGRGAATTVMMTQVAARREPLPVEARRDRAGRRGAPSGSPRADADEPPPSDELHELTNRPEHPSSERNVTLRTPVEPRAPTVRSMSAADPTPVDLAEFIAGLPKCELHLHLEGTLAPELKLELAAAQRHRARPRRPSPRSRRPTSSTRSPASSPSTTRRCTCSSPPTTSATSRSPT